MTMTREQAHCVPMSSTQNSGEIGAPLFAWQVIDEARHGRVTGELCLTTVSPSKIRLYLDSGLVYFAERETDESLATRLVLAGAIDPDQLHRGSLLLNGVEHLGRLFDRDASVERDEVELALELMTEQTLTEIAQCEVLSHQITMYRHHSSGVARWFAPSRAASSDVETPAVRVVRAAESVAWQPPSTEPIATAPPLGMGASAGSETQGESVDLPKNGLFDDKAALEATAIGTLPTRPYKPASYVPCAIQPHTPIAQPGAVQPLISIKALVSLSSPHVTAEPDKTAELIAAPAKLTPISGLKLTPISGQVKLISGAVPVTTNGHQLLASHDDSIPVPEDVAAAVRRAITAIEAATHGIHGSDGVNFGPMHVTSPCVTPPIGAIHSPPAPPRSLSPQRPGLVSLTGTQPGLVSTMVTGEQPVQSDTDPVDAIQPIVVTQTVGPVRPNPVIEAFVGSGRIAATAVASDARRGALRRLIAGVRRR